MGTGRLNLALRADYLASLARVQREVGFAHIRRHGNVTPPAGLGEWVDLVRALLRHLIDRYGIEEVRRWPIEVWNEPNLDVFWQHADRDAYFRLYEATARAVKEVDASLQVGGPAISRGSDDWWAPFADFVSSRDVPIDFVSRHAYSSLEPQLIPFGSYQAAGSPRGDVPRARRGSRHTPRGPRRPPTARRERRPAGR